MFSPDQQDKAAQRVKDMFSKGILPPGLAYSNVQHWVTNPSWLKSHGWQMMTGLVSMYLLLGFLGHEQEFIILNFLLTRGLIAKRFPRHELLDGKFRDPAISIVAEMEQILPAYESGVLRHMLIHLAERAETAGPLWTHAMWPWKQMWHRLVSWVHQSMNPCIQHSENLPGFCDSA